MKLKSNFIENKLNINYKPIINSVKRLKQCNHDKEKSKPQKISYINIKRIF